MALEVVTEALMPVGTAGLDAAAAGEEIGEAKARANTVATVIAVLRIRGNADMKMTLLGGEGAPRGADQCLEASNGLLFLYR